MAINVLVIGLLAKLLDSVTSRVPVGYQDDSGFHFGAKRG